MDWLRIGSSERALFEEALEWVDDIKSHRAADASFVEWVSRSPQHVEQLLCAWRTWEEIAALTPGQLDHIEKIAETLATSAKPHGKAIFGLFARRDDIQEEPVY